MELRLHRRQLALVGGDYEQRPYLGISFNWTSAYDQTTPDNAWPYSIGGDKLRVIELPADLSEHPRLSLIQHVHTRFSDIADIDAKESAKVWRTKIAGSGIADLAEVAALALGAKNRRVCLPIPMIDDMLVQRALPLGLTAMAKGDRNAIKDLSAAIVHAVEMDALEYALKGVYVLEARLVDPNVKIAIPRSPDLSAGGGLAPLQPQLEMDYIQVATEIPVERPPAMHNFPADVNSVLVHDLHMQSVNSFAGIYGPLGHLQQTPWQKGYKMGHMASLKHLETCFGGALLHKGMNPTAAIAAVEYQHQLQSPRATCTADYMAVLGAVMRMATNVANAIDYTSDSRYPNPHWLSHQSEDKQRIYAPELFDTKNGGPGKPLARVAMTEFALPADVTACLQETPHVPVLNRDLRSRMDTVHHDLGNQVVVQDDDPYPHPYRPHRHRRHRQYGRPAFHETAATTPGGRPKIKTWEQAILVSGESWDATILAGQSVCGDCEDAAGTIVGCLLTATATLESRKALHKVLSTSTPLMIGATVTEPYVDTTANASKGAVAPPHPELPLIGSVEDSKSSEGGHAYAVLHSRADLAERALRGLDHVTCASEGDRQRIATQLRLMVGSAPAWQLRQPILIGEGTGMVEPYILPPEETFAHVVERRDVMVAKAAARITMARTIKDPTSRLGSSVLARLCRIEAQPYEIKARPNPMQRISSFYREPVQLITPWLGETVSPLLGQLLAVDASRGTRGVDQGLYLRDTVGARDRVVFVSPLIQGKTEAWWRAEVLPRHMATVRQLPCSAWGMEPRATPLTTQVSQLLASPSVLKQGVQLGAAATFDAMPPVAHEAASSEDLALAETAHVSNDRTILSLSIPVWKFSGRDAADLETLLKEMKAKGEIRGHVLLRDRALPRANDQMQLLLILPVKA